MRGVSTYSGLPNSPQVVEYGDAYEYPDGYAYGSQDEEEIVNSFVNNVPARNMKGKKRKLSGDEVSPISH